METTAVRQTVNVRGMAVADMLVDVCRRCGTVVGWPKQSAGRLFAASVQRRSAASLHELRMPAEAVDLALAVHAALGIVPKGDVFALPIQLGLRVATAQEKPDPAWRALEGPDLRASIRARPVLTEETATRLDALRVAWGCDYEAAVVRRLVVAAYLKLT